MVSSLGFNNNAKPTFRIVKPKAAPAPEPAMPAKKAAVRKQTIVHVKVKDKTAAKLLTRVGVLKPAAS